MHVDGFVRSARGTRLINEDQPRIQSRSLARPVSFVHIPQSPLSFQIRPKWWEGLFSPWIGKGWPTREESSAEGVSHFRVADPTHGLVYLGVMF